MFCSKSIAILLGSGLAKMANLIFFLLKSLSHCKISYRSARVSFRASNRGKQTVLMKTMLIVSCCAELLAQTDGTKKEKYQDTLSIVLLPCDDLYHDILSIVLLPCNEFYHDTLSIALVPCDDLYQIKIF